MYNLLQEYYTSRHLSRYEQQYRISNQYDLQLYWNGLYDTSFMQQIVHFDDDYFLSLFDETHQGNNSADNDDNELWQQTYKNTTNTYHSYDNTSKIRRRKRKYHYNETQPNPRHDKQHRKSLSSSSSAGQNYV